MRFVSRAEWGARYAKGSGRIPGPVRGTTLHWEGPRMGSFPHTACAGKVRVIERFHAVTRGWSGIAYSAIVCPHGYVFEGRGTGVRSAANGTSAIGGNDRWYAVCYMSGQTDPFTDAAKAGMIDAVRWLRSKGGAGPAVNGHRDHHATECPGDVIYRWLQTADFNRAAPDPQPEDDMPTPQELLAAKVTMRDDDGKDVEVPLETVLRNLQNQHFAQADRLRKMDAKLDALLGKEPGA